MQNKIPLAEFKQVVTGLRNTDVLIRIRLAGERWMEYSRVISVSENAMILQEGEKPRRPIMNLLAVVEFAVDQPYADLSNIAYGVDRP